MQKNLREKIDGVLEIVTWIDAGNHLTFDSYATALRDRIQCLGLAANSAEKADEVAQQMEGSCRQILVECLKDALHLIEDLRHTADPVEGADQVVRRLRLHVCPKRYVCKDPGVICPHAFNDDGCDGGPGTDTCPQRNLYNGPQLMQKSTDVLLEEISARLGALKARVVRPAEKKCKK